MENKYITVAEFAELQGLSRQAVYQQIRKGALKQFVKQIDKRFYIDIQAFSAAGCKADCKETVKQIDNEFYNDLQPILEAKEAHIKSLEQQLLEQQRQIEFLQQQLERQTIIIDKQLHLQAHTQQLLTDEPPVSVAAAEPQPHAAAAPASPAPQRKNIFSRIFKK
jgi:TolA-binding protein